MFKATALVFCVILAVSAAVPQPAVGWPGAWGAAGAAGPGGAVVNPWLPPWIASAPWMPQWAPCTTVGATCSDCTTRQVCTKIGGIQKPCTDPTLPHCNLGECSATPSAECAPPTETPAA